MNPGSGEKNGLARDDVLLGEERTTCTWETRAGPLILPTEAVSSAFFPSKSTEFKMMGVLIPGAL